MSVTGHGAKTGHVRHPDDFYATPAWCTRAFLREAVLPVTFKDPDAVIDPCCGAGAILDVFAAELPSVRRYGIEIDAWRAGQSADRHAKTACGDALGPLPWGVPRSSSVMTNPPFSLAMEFVERSLAEVDGAVVMLLRLAWLASQKRAPFLRKHTPSVYVLPKRPSFTGKGTDSADYGWFVWRDLRPGRLHILDTDGAS